MLCLECGVKFTRDDHYVVRVRKLVWRGGEDEPSTDRAFATQEGYMHAKCPPPPEINDGEIATKIMDENRLGFDRFGVATIHQRNLRLMLKDAARMGRDARR